MKRLPTFFFFLLLFPLYFFCSTNFTIEKYVPIRDKAAITKILDRHHDFLRYESAGFPKGTTEKYIDSKKYQTYVLRVNDQTVGFVNFIVYDKYFLTFYVTRMAVLHLIGVDANYQNHGYGTALLRFAMTELIKLQAHTITLSTKKHNTMARKLCEKNNFFCLTIPALEQYMTNLFYEYNTGVIPNNMPKGNIVQRNKKIFAIICTLGISTLFALYKKST